MLKHILLTLFLMLVVSCAQTPTKKTPHPSTASAQEEFKAIKYNYHKKKYSRALSQLSLFLKKEKDGDLMGDAYLLQGHIFLKQKKYDEAFHSFMGPVQSQTYTPKEGEALSLAVETLFHLGRYDEALALIQKGLQLNDLPRSVEKKLLAQKLILNERQHDALQEFATLNQLYEVEDNEASKNNYLLKMQQHIQGSFTEDNLKTIIRQTSSKKLKALAYFRLGQFALEQQNLSEAQSDFEQVVRLYPESELAETSQDNIQQIQSRQLVDPRTIGVVLPLSGRHKNISASILKGLELGLGIFGPNPSPFQLALADSEGNPDASRRGLEQLVIENHVIAVVGSLLSKTSVAIASRCNDLRIPDISLSQKADLTQTGNFVFRNSLTSEMQVQALVAAAMEGKNLHRFAILYPNDPYGVEFANLFWDYVLARGGEITAVQPYDPSETDFGHAISKMIGTFYVDDRKDEYSLLVRKWAEDQKYINARTKPPEDILPSIIDFDALFIPDSSKALGQIAPMLAYHDVKNVTLLGTNLWNSSSFLERGQGFVEGSLFVDSLIKTDPQFTNSDFYKTYQETYNEAPNEFALQGYDTGKLLRQLLESGIRSREELQVALTQIKNVPGALRPISVNSQREFNRPVFDLQVSKGQIIKF